MNRETLARLVHALTGLHVRRSLPRGVDLAEDIAKDLPALRVDVVFDVGANVGQSAERYVRWFPAARIFCFEPVGETFAQLERATARHANVRSFRLALGATSATAEMVVDGASDRAFLAAPSSAGAPAAPAPAGARREAVEVRPLDDFCRDAAVDRIGFLKIDTEGGDLDVLRGAEQMLTEQRVDLVEVEAGMNRRNERHVPFETLNAHLQERNYFLFAIYEQFPEWPTSSPHLRRTNPVFVSERVIAAAVRSVGAR